MVVKNIESVGSQRTYIVALLAGAALLLVVAWNIYQRSLIPAYDYYNQPGSQIKVDVAKVDARIKAMGEAVQELKNRSTSTPVVATTTSKAPVVPVAPVVTPAVTSTTEPSQPTDTPAPSEYTQKMIEDREKAMMQGMADIIKQTQ